MGMFDTILCDYPLPLPELLKKPDLNWSKVDFQTKDLDCAMHVYHITAEGTLELEVIDREFIYYTPEEMRTLQPKPWSTVKEVVVKSKSIERISHHGKVTFYTSIEHTDEEDLWVDFEATFTYGKIYSVVCSWRTQKSQKLHEIEWKAAYEKERSRPWSRIKQALGHVGWYWIWRKIARGCNKAQVFLSNIHALIYKKMM